MYRRRKRSDPVTPEVDDELRRIHRGPALSDEPGPVGLARITFTSTRVPADMVVDRCREVLVAVLDHRELPDAQVDLWAEVLPGWLLAEFLPEGGVDLVHRERAEAAEEGRVPRWMGSFWLYWFRPMNRDWYWWDAGTDGSTDGWLSLQVVDWPFRWDALRWLIRVAGAEQISDPV